jgi:hypothetical protein
MNLDQPPCSDQFMKGTLRPNPYLSVCPHFLAQCFPGISTSDLPLIGDVVADIKYTMSEIFPKCHWQ